MARPQQHTITISEVPGRVKPWKAAWRELDAKTGKRERTSKYFDTEAEAKTFKQDAEALARTQPKAPQLQVPTAGLVTMRVHGGEWLGTIGRKKTAGTYESYRGSMERAVYPVIGDRLVSTIEPADIEHVIQVATDRGLAWGTQRGIILCLSSCFDWAIRHKRIVVNPCAKMVKELKNENAEDPEPNPLSEREAEAFLTWLQTGSVPAHLLPPEQAVDPAVPVKKKRARMKTRAGRPVQHDFRDWYPFFATLLLTGMRYGEAVALQWTKVFLDDDTCLRCIVDRSYSEAARRMALKGHKQFPVNGDVKVKTKKMRQPELHPTLATVLRELARTRKADALQEQRPLSPYVFLNQGQRLWKNHAAARVFRLGMAAIRATVAPNGKTHTIHDLRDTFATLHLLNDAGRVMWISWMLGHASRKMTMDRYARWIPESFGSGLAGTILTAAPIAAAGAPARPAVVSLQARRQQA